MTFYGTVTYDWHGTTRTAIALPHPLGVTPAASIGLCDAWVLVGRPGGPAIVAWDWIRELRGWSPVPAEDQQDSASDARTQLSRGNEGVADGERPMRCPTAGGRNDG